MRGGVACAAVYGVATFYHFFTLKPQGEHNCVVCLGTACYIKGAPHLIEAMEERYGIKPGETTPDGKVSLLTARCIGACGLAPAAVLDGNVGAKMTAPEFLTKVEQMAQSVQRRFGGGIDPEAQLGGKPHRSQ